MLQSLQATCRQNYTCRHYIPRHIINKHRGMSRYRKKTLLDANKKQHVIVIDSETDQAETARPASKKIKENDKLPSPAKRNPYEKIKEIPQVILTKGQMQGDPMDLILKLQQKYREYGAVKIRACAEWNPSFNFKYTEKAITTRIQKIHRLKQGKAFDEKKQEYNIKSFTDYAHNFQKEYKFKYERFGSTCQAEMQYEYWNVVKGPSLGNDKLQDKYKVTVEYAADLPAHHFGSGFPQFQSSRTADENFNYATSLFNLNNTYKSAKSILSISDRNHQKISGVTIPWVYMGMQFSSFCWHVEDLWLNSINYSHQGATKTWYVIPQSNKDKFDAYVLSKTGKRELLNSITYMIDPLELIQHGIQVFKAYQRPKEYILTLFNAYHSGFSQGFNVGQAVNVVNVDSLDMIRKAQAFNSKADKKHKPPVLCYDWLVSANLGNTPISQERIASEYTKIAAVQYQRLKKIMQRQKNIRLQFVERNLKYDRLTCHTCKHYQYLSALKCAQCDKKYCLQHTDKCCGEGFVLLSRESDKYRKRAIDLFKQRIN